MRPGVNLTELVTAGHEIESEAVLLLFAHSNLDLHLDQPCVVQWIPYNASCVLHVHVANFQTLINLSVHSVLHIVEGV